MHTDVHLVIASKCVFHMVLQLEFGNSGMLSEENQQKSKGFLLLTQASVPAWEHTLTP